MDGTEITEAVSTLIALSECGADVTMFAPDMEFQATDRMTRNVLRESARIARGKIESLNELRVQNFDALAFPGGFGAALHLCAWAKNGAECEVNKDAGRVIKEFYAAEKPICAVCIAPALIARVLGDEGISVTIGNDRETISEIAKTVAHHENCAVNDFVTDREHRIVTTPAYMYANAKPFEVYTGVRKAIREMIEMA
jgi:enhancing lycopene biosynthesis protein 2